MKKHQDYSMRRLPGPAGWRLGDGGNSRGSLGLIRDWQRTQTQSSVRTLRSLRQQMDVRSCGMQGPPAERQLLRVGNSDPRKWLRLASESGRRVLHLRLRYAQQGFAPSLAQHAGQLVNAHSCSRSDVQCAPSQARPGSSCFSLDNDLHGGSGYVPAKTNLSSCL